jgi:hypothetical protein
MSKKEPSKMRRKNKQKAKRLERETKMNELRKLVAHSREDAQIVLMKGDDEVVFAVRRGLFGHDRAPVFRVSHEDVVGAVEDTTQLGGLCTKLGVMVLAQLTGHHLSRGVDDLAKALAKWAGIDLAELTKEAEVADAADGGGTPGVPAGPAGDVPGPGGSDANSSRPIKSPTAFAYRPENEGL